MIRFFLTLALMGAIVFGSLGAVQRRSGYYEGDSVAINETRDTLDILKHRVENQETEIKAFEQKIENLDLVLESLRDQIEESSTSQKERLQGNANALEMKIASLESANKGIAADLKQLQSHANETSVALQSFKQKFADWEKRLQTQNQNIENLQSGLQTLVDAFQLKADIAPSSDKTYKIKNGDTLEKIAKTHGTTIQALKEANGMTSDKIVVGKTLKIP